MKKVLFLLMCSLALSPLRAEADGTEDLGLTKKQMRVVSRISQNNANRS